MSKVYQAATVEVKGARKPALLPRSFLLTSASEAKDRSSPDLPKPESLSILLSTQLATCINALDAGDGDNVIGECRTCEAVVAAFVTMD